MSKTPETQKVFDWFRSHNSGRMSSFIGINRVEVRMEQMECERDEARKECEEQARLLGMSAEREADLRAKLERIRRGHEGTCYACEVVGELNRKYRATLDKIRAAIEDTTI